MTEQEGPLDPAPPPKVDDKAFRETQFSPKKNRTAQMVNQSEEENK